MLQVDSRELTESITSRNQPNLLSQTSDSRIVSTFLNHIVSNFQRPRPFHRLDIKGGMRTVS